jgi:hypothetical protein
MFLDGARRSAAATLLVLALAACDSATPSAGPSAPLSPSAGASAGPSESVPPPSAATSAPTAGPTGGAPSPTGAPTAAPRPTASVLGVKLVKQGGIAGIDQTIEVRPDGSWKRTSDGNTTSSGKLPGDQMAQLQKLLADPRLPAEGKRATGLGRCSDAFVYVLTTGGLLVHYTACGQQDKPEVTLKIIELLQNATK